MKTFRSRRLADPFSIQHAKVTIAASLLPLLAATFGMPAPIVASQAGAETLVLFDFAASETPESIVFDRRDNAYISLANTGEVVKVDEDVNVHPLAQLPIGAPCAVPQPTVALGLAFDQRETLYIAISACDPANHGIWTIDKDTGAIELLANVPQANILNGIDVDGQYLYAADTFLGFVWRIPIDGSSVPEIWADDPLLKRPPGAMFPGPNGLKVFRGEVYVANSSTGTIVAIPIGAPGLGGSAGTARVHATLPFPQGCDEFAFDVHGSIYCTTDPFNTIVRLDPDGTTETLLTASDLLDGPTSVAFGRRGTNRKNLYITNAAFPIFTTTFRPSLMRLRLDVPGAP